jgi:hypothetical protein
MPKQDEKKPWRQRLAELSGKAMAASFAGIIAPFIAAFLIFHFVGPGGSSSSTPPSEPATPTNHHFTVEDIDNHGVWELNTPTATKLLPRNSRPANAREWLTEGASATITCAKKGSAYGIENREKHEIWHWWAHLTNGSWVAMAAFKQTKRDGSQGFETCS